MIKPKVEIGENYIPTEEDENIFVSFQTRSPIKSILRERDLNVDTEI